VFFVAVEVVVVVVVIDLGVVVVVIDGINVSDLPLGFCRLLGFFGESILTDLVPSAGLIGLMSTSFVVGFGVSATVDTDFLFGPVAFD